MIDRGLKQIAVATATPVLDRPLPVSTPLVVARGARGLRVRLSPYRLPFDRQPRQLRTHSGPGSWKDESADRVKGYPGKLNGERNSPTDEPFPVTPLLYSAA